ncbi:MAG: CPBP family intramembrane metalloprotease [Bacteroidales bacterium]|nr:CPBP family intramembrane metalloprotease [Bacteroidales bacterium]
MGMASCSKRLKIDITLLLKIGIGLYVGSYVLLVLCQIFNYQQNQDLLLSVIDKLIDYTSSIVTLIIVSVLIPIIEELAFRFWGIKKKYASIISLLFISVYILLTGNIFLAISAFIVLGILFFIVKENELLLIITTSIIFSILHIDGFSSVNIKTILSLINIFSFAVILCCVTIKYHFILAVGIHIINNLIAISPQITSAKIKEDNFMYYRNIQSMFSTNDYSVSLKPITDENDYTEQLYNDVQTISFSGSLSSFVELIQILDTNKTINSVYKIDKSIKNVLPDYVITLNYKTTDSLNYNNILNDVLQSIFSRCDTIYSTTYSLNIIDFSKLNNDELCNEISLRELAIRLESFYGIPIMLDDDINEKYPIFVDNDLFVKNKPLEELKELLIESYGIELIQINHCKKQVLEFYD